jgi:hypothetical protein
MASAKKIHLKLSQPQHTDAGNLLGRMYYGHFIDSTTTREERSGYPHNGGEHTLYMDMTADDFEAWAQLIEYQFPKHPGTPVFCGQIREKIRPFQ